MPVDIFFHDDLQRTVASVTVAALMSAAAHGGGNIEYVRGVLDAQHATALALGVSWSKVQASVRDILGEQWELIERIGKGAIENERQTDRT